MRHREVTYAKKNKTNTKITLQITKLLVKVVFAINNSYVEFQRKDIFDFYVLIYEGEIYFALTTIKMKRAGST